MRELNPEENMRYQRARSIHDRLGAQFTQVLNCESDPVPFSVFGAVVQMPQERALELLLEGMREQTAIMKEIEACPTTLS